MPHSIFVGSALATQDRLSSAPLKDDNKSASSLGPLSDAQHRRRGILSRVKSSLSETFRVRALDNHKGRPQRHEDKENSTYRFVESHIHHGVMDVVLSLLGVAVVINSM